MFNDPINPNETVRQGAIRHIKSINKVLTDEYLNDQPDYILVNLVHPNDRKFYANGLGVELPDDDK